MQAQGKITGIIFHLGFKKPQDSGFWGGHIQQSSGFTSGGLRYHMGCQQSNPGPKRARQMPYMLCYCSSPDSELFYRKEKHQPFNIHFLLFFFLSLHYSFLLSHFSIFSSPLFSLISSLFSILLNILVILPNSNSKQNHSSLYTFHSRNMSCFKVNLNIE